MAAPLPDAFFPAHPSVALVDAVYGARPVDGEGPESAAGRYCRRYRIARTRADRWELPSAGAQETLGALVGRYAMITGDPGTGKSVALRLLAHPMSPVSGNARGDVTLVEFFDYQCGYCKRSLGPVMDLLRSDAKLRVVWKELPVLGLVSRFAARASMAAARQGKYLVFHEAMMGAPGGLTEDAAMAIAGWVGLDVARLRRDMADSAIEAYLDETHRLAKALGITGTPVFVIGDTLVPGAVGGARLKELIAEAGAAGTGPHA